MSVNEGQKTLEPQTAREKQSPRRKLQDQIYRQALLYFRGKPEAPETPMVLLHLALGAYHLSGYALRQLAKRALEAPLMAALEAPFLLMDRRYPKLPLREDAAKRLAYRASGLAEALIREGGDMRTAVRILSLDPRLLILLLQSESLLTPREVWALAQLLVYQGKRWTQGLVLPYASPPSGHGHGDEAPNG